MASSLRSKLSIMNKPSGTKTVTQPSAGLVVCVNREKMPDSIYNLDTAALRRIGWTGGKFDIEKCLFIDTETTGLSGGAGTVAFMTGLGHIENGVMTIEQYMMCDYSDEPDMLFRVRDKLSKYDCVITFNGKTFDMPLLSARFTMNRLVYDDNIFNLDLLQPSRRVWRLRLESCRLCVLEEKVLNMGRVDDLPGSEAPERFFKMLKTGDKSVMTEVLEHNKQDIATLAHLLIKLCDVYETPEKQEYIQDLFSLGKALEKQGESAKARELYSLSAIPQAHGTLTSLKSESLAGEANIRLYRLLMRSKDYARAKETLETMIRRSQLGCTPYIEMAKLYEHKYKDYAIAIRHTRTAIKMSADIDEIESLKKRETRLAQKLSNRRD